MPVPAFALKLALGEASSSLLASQRVEPRRLRELGFGFQFPTLEQAITDILDVGTESAQAPIRGISPE
jgi:hypothetical protein